MCRTMLDGGLLAQPAMKDLLRTKRSLIRGQHRVEDVHQNTWLKSENYQAGGKQMKPTDEQVVEWARKAQVANAWDINWFDPYYASFAILAYEAGAAAEREACAKVCEDAYLSQRTALFAAGLIRARGQG